MLCSRNLEVAVLLDTSDVQGNEGTSMNYKHKIRRSVPPATFQSLVVTLVLTRLDYWNAVLVGLPTYLVQRWPLFTGLCVSERIEYKIALLTFRVLHGSAPPYLVPLVPVRSLPGRRSLRSTGDSHLLVPLVMRSTVGSRAIPVAGSKTWNALPEDVTSSQFEYTFRCQLRTLLFKKSFEDIIIWYWLPLDF